MDANKVLVFDNYHYFARFLKYEFKDIKFILGEKESILYGNEMINEFCLVVFVFYSEEDLVNLLRVYSYGIKLLVCNQNNKFENKFKNVRNIDVMECLEPKSAYRGDLKLYFKEEFSSLQLKVH